MSSFMRFFRGANGAEEQQQQPPQQQQGRSAQSSSQQQQRPSSSSSSSRRGGGPASPPKAKAGAGQQQQHQQHNNKRAHGHGQKPKAAAAAEGPSPSRGGKATKMGDGTMSPMSAMALNQLQGYSDQLDVSGVGSMDRCVICGVCSVTWTGSPPHFDRAHRWTDTRCMDVGDAALAQCTDPPWSPHSIEITPH